VMSNEIFPDETFSESVEEVKPTEDVKSKKRKRKLTQEEYNARLSELEAREHNLAEKEKKMLSEAEQKELELQERRKALQEKVDKIDASVVKPSVMLFPNKGDIVEYRADQYSNAKVTGRVINMIKKIKGGRVLYLLVGGKSVKMTEVDFKKAGGKVKERNYHPRKTNKIIEDDVKTTNVAKGIEDKAQNYAEQAKKQVEAKNRQLKAAQEHARTVKKSIYGEGA